MDYYNVNRVVVRKGVIVTRDLVERMGVKVKAPIHMTKGFDSGNRSKSRDIQDRSSQEPLGPNIE